MSWIQLSVDAGRHKPIDIEEALLALGAVSVSLVDTEDQPVFEPAPGETPLWQKTTVVGLFEETVDADEVTRSLHDAFSADLIVQTETVADRDWERVWMDAYHPMQFGNRLWICPTHCTPPDPNAINIMLDPGLAFGTGTHPTTQMCLQWLDAHPLNDKIVIDFGCGSGILGIAALLLGAKHVYAVDIDPQAVLATKENAERNGVATRLTVGLPEEISLPTADVLAANILANPLIALASKFAGHVKPDGAIVLSGILHEQAEDVAKAYKSAFRMRAPEHSGDWSCLSGDRIGS